MIRNYKDFVGPQARYHATGRERFELLLREGLNERHDVLDIGAGSLRLGRLLIPFLEPGRYHALEPGEEWLRDGLQEEVVAVFGEGLVGHKRPVFEHNDRFDLTPFGKTFDFVVAFSVFIHCGREQLETCLANVRAATAEGSVVLIDLNIGERSYSSGRHSKYPWASAQKTRYEREDAEALMSGAGFASEVLDERVNAKKLKTRVLYRLRPVPPA